MSPNSKNNRREPSVRQYLKRSLPAIYIAILCVNTVIPTTNAQSYATFNIPESDSILQNQFLDADNDVLYMGALNYIYKLDNNLTLLQSVMTGPVNDSAECRPPPSADCVSDKTITDNYNKVILLHQDRLITCGSIYQGTCKLRDPDSLSVAYGGSKRAVVPNTPSGSAVAYIADSTNGQVMYVASSYGDWLENEVTVSTRQISRSVQDDNLFRTTPDRSQIIIPIGTINDSPVDRQFNISYIYGFTSGQFSYFVASQPSNHLEITRYTSKVVRLCHGDPDFDSYIELPLSCSTSVDNEYNLVQSAHVATLSLDGAEPEAVLVATFSKSETDTSGTPTADSAVCIYPIKDINQVFWNRRLACAKGRTGTTEIGWAGSTGCSNNVLLTQQIMGQSPDEYCHTFDVQTPLGGDNRAITISASPVYKSTTYITAVAAVQHFETSIIFTGDSSGVFKKLRLDDGSSAVEYKTLDLHQSPVIRNGLLLSSDEQFIYVTSEDQITKVPVEECEEYTTCESCHGALDPYCGWCSLQAKCTRRIDAECSDSQDGQSLKWLSSGDECLSITSVTPEFAAAKTETELMLDIASLPPIPSEGSLRCLFVEDGAELGTVPAVASGGSQVTCSTPGDIQGTDKGFRTVELQVSYNENGERYNIAATAFDFYDCSKFPTCSSCTGKQYGCEWRLNSNECLDGNAGVDGIQDNNSCPLVHSIPEVVIPSGGQESFSFMVDNIPSNTGFECGVIHWDMFCMPQEVQKLVMNQSAASHHCCLSGCPVIGHQVHSMVTKPSTFSCEITFQDGLAKTIEVDAVANQTSISCNPALFNYSGSQVSISGSLQVYWGEFPLDMESEQIVTIYKCNRKAVTMLDGQARQTCGMCLSIDDRYECGWCRVSNDCLSSITADRCPADASYLRKGMGCPNPSIVSISPVTGHISGGTRVTITGYNLGLNQADVRSISIAGTPCTSVEFVSSQMLYCTTGSVLAIRQGPVTVDFNSSTTSSPQEFNYVVPSIMTSYPSVGPQSGGTRLVVRGTNMDAGLNRSVMITSTPCAGAGSGHPCEIIESNADEIICRTSAGNITDGVIAVIFDDGCESPQDSKFEYGSDPVVNKFEKLISIQSGGINLEITGESFHIIQEAFLEFEVGPDVLTENCSNSSSDGTTLTCKSPNISATDLPLRVPVGNMSLHMDGVARYLDLGRMFPGTNQAFFEFVTDPVYDPLPAGENIMQFPFEQQRKDLTLNGTNLTLASALSDVTVTVGGRDCMILKLIDTSLRCQLKEQDESGKYSVTVLHGYRTYNVGQVEYLAPVFPLWLLASLIAGGVMVILVLIIIIISYYCCLNFSNNEKQFRELEEQRDAMEMVVAQECKEAFAELQTGVLSITNDVEGTGIPMWDYKSYTMWALFPHQHNHPVLRELAVPPAQRESVRKGLNRFGLLLANKSFLVHFVEVLEKQNTIGVEDLSNVASLLMVCFQGRMDYATEVMKTLLRKAIKEHVREGQEAVLMRRGGHMVEKIVSHWLAFLMYPYLEEVAGDPLFSLFYALHRKISSGPVDEISTQARYGLNEGALIRQKIEHRVVNLSVKGIDNNLDMTKAGVLDCDTIGQVKEKILEEIYKTQPYSNRLHKGEVDLEWLDSPNGKVILMDYSGLKTTDGWRQLNTLKTYGVQDNATVVLLQAQNGNTSMSSSSSSPSRSIVYANMSPTSSMTPIITHEKEQGAPFMHLIKQTGNGTRQKADSTKMIAEIYLTRLLTTKGIIQPFVDDMFATIMTVEENGTNLPLPIKYLFDFLDEQAAANNITDANVIHQWKTNCLQLRFWVNLIKNPNFVFDISKTPAVDNCLSVIGQCLMDSCSTSQQTLTKDSPSSRLLYAKEIPKYREMVVGYYKSINAMPQVSDQDMNTMLADFSSQHKNTFHTLTALNELYFCYACKCRDEVLLALQRDESTKKYNLADKLLEVERLLAG